jgi:hypothetical protein
MDGVNRNGNPSSLVPQPGNTHAVRHGIYSERMREPRAEQYFEDAKRYGPVRLD